MFIPTKNLNIGYSQIRLFLRFGDVLELETFKVGLRMVKTLVFWGLCLHSIDHNTVVEG